MTRALSNFAGLAIPLALYGGLAVLEISQSAKFSQVANRDYISPIQPPQMPAHAFPEGGGVEPRLDSIVASATQNNKGIIRLTPLPDRVLSIR